MPGTYYPNIRQQLETELRWLAHAAYPGEEDGSVDELFGEQPYRDEQLLLALYDELTPWWQREH